MTASGVELLSCRVQLVGLPQSAATNRNVIVDSGDSIIIRQNEISSTILPLPSREVAPPRRVSRNLFGSPQPGEVRELLHKETLQQRSKFLKRYNFDILCPPNSADNTKITTRNEPVYPLSNHYHSHYQLPSLIAKESLNHEKKLMQQNENAKRDDCNLSRNPNSGLQSPLISYSSSNSSLKKSGQVRRTVTAPAVITSEVVGEANNLTPVLVTQNSASERLKPYARQTLITECFSLRKIPHTNLNNNSTAIPMITISQQQQLNILQLPKAEHSVALSTSTSIPSSATKRDSVQADYTISLTSEAINENQ